MPKQAWINSMVTSHEFPDQPGALALLSEYWDKSRVLEGVPNSMEDINTPKMFGSRVGTAMAGFIKINWYTPSAGGVAGAYIGEQIANQLLSESVIEKSRWIRYLSENLSEGSSPADKQEILADAIASMREKVGLKNKKDRVECAGQAMAAIAGYATIALNPQRNHPSLAEIEVDKKNEMVGIVGLGQASAFGLVGQKVSEVGAMKSILGQNFFHKKSLARQDEQKDEGAAPPTLRRRR